MTLEQTILSMASRIGISGELVKTVKAIKRSLRSFCIDGTTFHPCQWQDSTSQGMRWFAEINHPIGMTWSEQYSPQFRTKADCRDYAQDRLKKKVALAQ
jgi:hypothetical protein